MDPVCYVLVLCNQATGYEIFAGAAIAVVIYETWEVIAVATAGLTVVIAVVLFEALEVIAVATVSLPWEVIAVVTVPSLGQHSC